MAWDRALLNLPRSGTTAGTTASSTADTQQKGVLAVLMAVLPVVVSLLGEFIWTLAPAVLQPVLAVLPL